MNQLDPCSAVYPTFDNSYVLQLTDDTFEHTVSDRPVFIQFYAPWCGHCKNMAPAWNDAATLWHTQYYQHIHSNDNITDAYSKGYSELNQHIAYNTLKQQIVEPVLFAKIDCVSHRTTCSRFNIHSYPKMRLIVPYEHTLEQLRNDHVNDEKSIDVYSIKKTVYNFEGPRSINLFIIFIQNYKFTAHPLPYPYTKQIESVQHNMQPADAIQQHKQQNSDGVFDRTIHYINTASAGDSSDRRFLVIVIAVFMMSLMGLIGIVIYAVTQYLKLTKANKAT